MGSKSRIAKDILPIVLKERRDGQIYVEPFVGGCNMIDKVTGGGYRIANDYNYYLIAMWKALQSGWIPPKNISKEQYRDIRLNKEFYQPELVGYVGFCCSYSGKWFGGYAGIVETKGGVRNYIQESYDNVIRQSKLISDIEFYSGSYLDLDFVSDAIIYCDPPYKGTTEYKDSFDHDIFWEWVRIMSEDNQIFVSEYSAPEDFTCIWEKEVKSSLSANGKVGGNKNSIERLFIYKN